VNPDEIYGGARGGGKPDAQKRKKRKRCAYCRLSNAREDDTRPLVLRKLPNGVVACVGCIRERSEALDAAAHWQLKKAGKLGALSKEVVANLLPPHKALARKREAERVLANERLRAAEERKADRALALAELDS